MKKLMFAAAAALCATAGFCVESANIVGYQTTGFDKSGWMMNVGVAFSNVGAADGAFTLDDAFFGGTATEGDQIITLDADAWDLNTYDKLGAGEGWMLTPPGGTGSELLPSIKASKGDLLYYIPAIAQEATIAGEVADMTAPQSVTFDLNNEAGQWMFPLVNPYPVETTWGDLNTFTKEGDQIITLDADLWDLNTYDRLGDGYGWMLTPPGGTGSEIITDESLIAIPAGGSVYYIPTETVTWTVTL